MDTAKESIEVRIAKLAQQTWSLSTTLKNTFPNYDSFLRHAMFVAQRRAFPPPRRPGVPIPDTKVAAPFPPLAGLPALPTLSGPRP